METFLQQVAHDLYQKTGGDFSRVAVVFPNKRAGLFFNECLARETDHPLWSPAYISISDLFRAASPLTVGDPIQLVCLLYKVFTRITGSQETLDDFYFWGELLISDFDDADKNLVDTDALFSNLKDLHGLTDNYEFLEEGQREALSQFFHHFSMEQSTELKRRFIALWETLGAIYTDFKALLDSQQTAYEGMLYRRVIEELDPAQLPYHTYVFVGFNVLNRVEHRLFSRLQEAGKALFYWDYDTFYLNRHPHEAGEFILRNLHDFPSELPPDVFRHLDSPKEVTFIESPTENGQVRYLPQWLRENLTTPEKETAVVLCNESLLQSTLHALPENVRHLNVTMGFPLSHTPAYSFISSLLNLYTDGYRPQTGRYLYNEVLSVLKHPYTRLLSPLAGELLDTLTTDNRFYPFPSELQKDEALTALFTPAETPLQLCRQVADALQAVGCCYRQQTASSDAAYDQLYREALFQAYTRTVRFVRLIESGDLTVQSGTLKRLVTRVMENASIPFHGEPAIGLQVMGVLETRNLDFRHLILLSVDEGQLPKTGGDASFIPYNLRKAFGMTTIDHKIAVYAYYFYRLLQRAEKVTLMYHTASDAIHRGEMSRFLLQFLVEWNHPVRRLQLQAGQSPHSTTPMTVVKTPDVLRRMVDLFDLRNNPKALLSPTALNTYLDCPLKFYLRYIAQITAPDEVTAEVDAAKFGSIFHYAAEHIYKDLTAHGKVIQPTDLDTLLKDDVRLRNYVDNGFKELFFHVAPDVQPEYDGTQLVNAEVILRYVRQLLRHDRQYAPFTFVQSEKFVQEDIQLTIPGLPQLYTRIGGIIDRIDSKDGVFRIVDYKTGGKPDIPTSVASLFTPDKKRSGYVFQTFLYAAIVCRKLREANISLQVAPSLLYIHQAAGENYSPVIQMGEARKAKEPVFDFARYEESFREALDELLGQLFNPHQPFMPTDIEEKCEYCDFRRLCGRQ